MTDDFSSCLQFSLSILLPSRLELIVALSTNPSFSKIILLFFSSSYATFEALLAKEGPVRKCNLVALRDSYTFIIYIVFE